MFRGLLREVHIGDIGMIFEWRNREDIRKNMYTHEEIDYVTHKKWFSLMLQNSSSKYFIYEQNSVPLGLVSFTNIDNLHQHASWAFYSADLSIRGVGSEMEKLALQYAFNDLNLNKLNCEVLEFNFPVVSFHQKHGFKIEGIKKKHYKRGEKYYDIYQLAIFKKDYQKIFEAKFKSSIDKSYTWSFTIEEETINKFALVSGDKNPIHIDNEYAKEVGFEGRIAHGAILVAEISKIAATNYPGPNTVYLSQKVDYLAPVYPGTKVDGRAKLLTQIGRYCLIRYELLSGDKLLASSYSEFLLGK